MDIIAIYRRLVFWISDFLKGSPIRKPYKEIEYISTHSKSEGDKIRMEKLKALLRHARSNTEFYSSIDSECLTDFPVMNKSLLLEHYDDIAVDINRIPGQTGPLHIQSTSGSTGTPFAIPQDTLKRYRRIAELKYFGKAVGFRSHDRLIHLRTWNKWQNKTQKQIRTENIIPFDISSMGKDRLETLSELIRTSKAVCLRGYASSFDLLAQHVKDNGGSFPSLKIIIAGSEALHEDTRAKVKKYLRCEIISQYANEECGILAQEVPPTSSDGNVMYLNHSGYIFEILKPESDEPAGYGEPGRIVITDLHNYAFPIIRYDSGDIGVMLAPDERSNGHPVLGKLYGRRFDICYTTSGLPFFPMTIGRILKHFDQIIQWQFVQKGEKEYLLRLIVKDSYVSSSTEAVILKELKDILGEEASVKTEITDDIPVLSSGKRKPVVNEWKR